MNFHSSSFYLRYLALNFCSTFLPRKKNCTMSRFSSNVILHEKPSLYQMWRIPPSVLTQYFASYALIFTVEALVPHSHVRNEILAGRVQNCSNSPHTFMKQIRYGTLFMFICIIQLISLHRPCALNPYLFYELDITFPVYYN